jgi:hypothetical protein
MAGTEKTPFFLEVRDPSLLTDLHLMERRAVLGLLYQSAQEMEIVGLELSLESENRNRATNKYE